MKDGEKIRFSGMSDQQVGQCASVLFQYSHYSQSVCVFL